MLLVNTDFIPGREFEVLGLVSGVGVPPVKFKLTTKGMGEVIEEGVERADQRMIEKARQLGADAIIKVFYDKEVSDMNAQILVYGTAVRLR